MTPLMHQYHINTLGIGAFASAFYLGYAIFQLPGGYLLDNIPLKPLFAISVLLCSISYAAFLFAHQFWLGYLLRVVIGITSALSFMGILFIARITLSANAFTLIAGLAISIGTVAASCVQIIGVWLMHHWAWQWALSVFALLGIIIALLFLCVPTIKTHRITTLSLKGVIQQSVQFLKNPLLIYNALIGSLFYLPTTLFASLWGVPFLIQTKAFTQTEATFSIFLLFLGWAIGAPLMSLAANQLTRTHRLLQLFASLALVIALLLLYAPLHQHVIIQLLVFALGLASSAQAVVWKLFDKYCPTTINGVGLAWTNMLIMISGTVFHVCVGYLLTLRWLKVGHHFNYALGLAIIPLAFFVVALAAKQLKE